VESESGKQLFAVQAPLAGRGGLAGVVDQLSDRIRRELRERADDRALRRPVAESVTASAEAARWYYEGIDCLTRMRWANGNARQCTPPFERALALDPTFPLAHYQLAAANVLRGDSGELARPHLLRALAASARMPHREAQLATALALRLDGKSATAARIYDELLALAPEDPELLALGSDVRVEQGDWESAERYLEKLVAVAPEQEYSLLLLVEALGRLNRTDDLGALLRRLSGARPRRWRAMVELQLWLGDGAAALETARRSVAEDGQAELGTLVYGLEAAGEYMELERVAQELVRTSPERTAATRDLEVALTGQGRIVEALRLDEERARRLPGSAAAGVAYRQAIILAATRDPARVWPSAARAFALDPVQAADLAVVLELLGDGLHAAVLAARLQPESHAAEQYRALRAWRAGDAAGAVALLAQLERRDPWPVEGLAPSYLQAEVASAAGDAIGAIAAVERFERLPADRGWRAWAYPRSLQLSALAHRWLGDGGAAREEQGRLAALFARADPAFLDGMQLRGVHAPGQ
jgi:tetratricopeptide (TPR) repeat protein